MVHYVLTPWRDRRELLLVRRQLYAPLLASGDIPALSHAEPRTASRQAGDGDEGLRRKNQHHGVARVSMWMQRGNCPHMVESTALLMAAMLSDEDARASENAASSTYTVRAAYSAAFSRFVTGLLDGHQDKQRKQSMYSIAKTIGLPATFVELRHQSTHEQLPSLAKLRSAAKKALTWIWDYYWKHLGEEGEGECRDAVLAYLREEDEAKSWAIVKDLAQWPREHVLEVVKELQGTLPGNKVFVRCVQLTQDLKVTDASNDEDEFMALDTETEQAEDQLQREHSEGRSPEIPEDAEEDVGWFEYKGTWKAKPIGTV